MADRTVDKLVFVLLLVAAVAACKTTGSNVRRHADQPQVVDGGSGYIDPGPVTRVRNAFATFSY